MSVTGAMPGVPSLFDLRDWGALLDFGVKKIIRVGSFNASLQVGEGEYQKCAMSCDWHGGMCTGSQKVRPSATSWSWLYPLLLTTKWTLRLEEGLWLSACWCKVGNLFSAELFYTPDHQMFWWHWTNITALCVACRDGSSWHLWCVVFSECGAAPFICAVSITCQTGEPWPHITDGHVKQPSTWHDGFLLHWTPVLPGGKVVHSFTVMISNKMFKKPGAWAVRGFFVSDR